ncbi:MAG: A/G-specific adenine glycosylase [Gemmatimonadota bacterium]|nr:MAG: A/G-specific adenine glycosylase [Gemmatimonadota bacterium]
MSVPTVEMATYRRALVSWYRRAARDLPWRRDPSPYRVWVSEIMLQQTRVDTVLRYFDRFLERFPSVEALAAAGEEAVLEAWSGLGYYRRARNLHAGAQVVVEVHGGEFPRDEAGALSIPGIGRYTAGAVRSIAYGERAPILDGNVQRVLSRVFGVEGDPQRVPASRTLWELAAAVVGAGDPSEVNQAQMELGALVCTPRDPACGACPLNGSCVAFRDGRVEELPALAARKKSVPIQRAVLLVRTADRILLRRRGPDELLPGLWDLPGAFAGDDDRAATGPEDVRGLVPFAVEILGPLGMIRHAVTHRRVRLDVFAAEPVSARPGPGGPDPRPLFDPHSLRDRDHLWITPTLALDRALSSPARRIVRRWGSVLDSGTSSPVSC